MSAPIIVNIDPTGTVQFVWNDLLRGLIDEGTPTIQRASHVEPTPDGQWTADLSPVGGPTLGPYAFRSDALTAETDWLTANLLKG